MIIVVPFSQLVLPAKAQACRKTCAIIIKNTSYAPLIIPLKLERSAGHTVERLAGWVVAASHVYPTARFGSDGM